MKCDVCGTKIPIGQHECPSCGYKMKSTHTNVYDASGVNHEHIKSSYHQTKRKDNFDYTKKLSQNMQSKKAQVAIAIAVIVIILAIVSAIAIPQFVNKYVNPYEYMDFEQVIEQGDDDGSVGLALNKEKELELFMEETGFKDIQIDESVSYYDEQISAHLRGSGNHRDIRYIISFDFTQKKCVTQLVNMSFETDESLREKQSLDINEDVYNKAVSYIGVDEGIDFIESKLSQMSVVEDDKNLYEYANNGDLYLYMSERHEEGFDSYRYYFAIEKMVN